LAIGPTGFDAATVTVTVVPKTTLPAFTAAGVVNAASFKAPISAGSIAALFGTNLSAGTAEASTVPLPTQLTGTQVLVNGVAVPLFFVSPGQINFQVPVETAGQSATVQVINALGASTVITVPLASAAPGLFVGGDGNVIAQDSEWALVTTANPAKAGDVVVMYGTGFGPAACRPKTGETTPAVECRTLTTPHVTVGNQEATVLYSGLASGMIGVYQLNLIVPMLDPSTPTVPVVVDMAGQKSQDTAQVAVAQ